ncbi:MAG: HAD family phosphatase [Polyangiaceae bacterium]
MRATLFDFNGVIADDEHIHLACFRDAVARQGITISDADYKDRYLGFDDAGAFAAILSDAGHAPDPDLVARLVEAKKPLYLVRADAELRIFEGARELILRRAALGPVVIVSGALDHEIVFCLNKMGITHRVLFRVAADHVRSCKPDPEGYLLAMTKLAPLGVTSAVVIEDSLAGIVAAKAASLRCVAVAHTYSANELTGSGADAVAATLEGLTDELLDGTPPDFLDR